MDNFKRDDYLNDLKPSWCKGCSFYGVLSALTRALASQSTDPSKVNIISGIGCSSRMSLYMSTRAMHTLHGRAIPVAIGARLANPENPVIVIGGDGDLFSIGAGHFLHAARINADITVICLNNRMYAMTKNQSSPTSQRGIQAPLPLSAKRASPLTFQISPWPATPPSSHEHLPAHLCTCRRCFQKHFHTRAFLLLR